MDEQYYTNILDAMEAVTVYNSYFKSLFEAVAQFLDDEGTVVKFADKILLLKIEEARGLYLEQIIPGQELYQRLRTGEDDLFRGLHKLKIKGEKLILDDHEINIKAIEDIVFHDSPKSFAQALENVVICLSKLGTYLLTNEDIAPR